MVCNIWQIKKNSSIKPRLRNQSFSSQTAEQKFRSYIHLLPIKFTILINDYFKHIFNFCNMYIYNVLLYVTMFYHINIFDLFSWYDANFVLKSFILQNIHHAVHDQFYWCIYGKKLNEQHQAKGS